MDPFDHEKLDVYQTAVDWVSLAQTSPKLCREGRAASPINASVRPHRSRSISPKALGSFLPPRRPASTALPSAQRQSVLPCWMSPSAARPSHTSTTLAAEPYFFASWACSSSWFALIVEPSTCPCPAQRCPCPAQRCPKRAPEPQFGSRATGTFRARARARARARGAFRDRP
jgi:hypothetical protein